MVQQATAAFDPQRVSKRFYRQFQHVHASFAGAISGLPDLPAQTWYSSVMLNRLLVIAFLQARGLLDSDLDYLANRLAQLQAGPADSTAYQQFLLRLFHQGLSQPVSSRSPELIRLIGAVPYLPSGLFGEHPLERTHRAISIPDAAFSDVFALFAQYRWRLDPADNDAQAMTPDVLGTLFEKYINNKQLGAYYTRSDITGYICENTLLPRLLERVAAQNPAAFAAGGSVWGLLGAQPERYIYAAVRHGVDLALPPEIAAGLADSTRRTSWNTPAPAAYGLPTETWREYLARRERCHTLRAHLRAGAITSVNELVTSNLDIGTFAQDLIASCSEVATLRAIYSALTRITVLDPTCGSGAFLLAALTILAPLYAACLGRMELLLEHAQQAADDSLADIQAIVGSMGGQQPSARAACILKLIMLNNLYGVDLMDEAVELCKLRLLLKLLAHAETPADLEGLPDLDFNIWAGNALVGYGPHSSPGEKLDHQLLALQQVQGDFRAAQGRSTTAPAQLAALKAAASAELAAVNALLDGHLAKEYTVGPRAFARWRESHRPLHWPAAFPEIVRHGSGFDVIIGNPPYLAYSKVKAAYRVRSYATEPCGNLYALTVERSLQLLGPDGRFGMIVPIASVSTQSMAELQQLYQAYPTWHSHFGVRPGKLFPGVDMNLTITLLQHTVGQAQRHTTGYRRWSDSAHSDREMLFATLDYTPIPPLPDVPNPFPKLGSALEVGLLQKLASFKHRLRAYLTPEGEPVYFHSGGRYWRKALPTRLSSHYRVVYTAPQYAPILINLLNSQLFYWYWIINSNCMDVVSREVYELPVFAFEGADLPAFRALQEELLQAYAANQTTRQRHGELIEGEEINFDVGKAKPIIDRIDRLLARHYGLSAEELDFILNYDIKYRVKR